MIRRTKVQRPDLILTSDWHLREEPPVCRMDDFWEAQWKKVGQIMKLQNDFSCPVLCAGDLFHHWKPSPRLISQSIKYLPSEFYTVAGQHDLPQHNLDLIEKSGLFTLLTAGVLHWFKGSGNWGQEVAPAFITPHTDRRVGVWHHFVWDGETLPWPGCDEMTALQVLKKYPEFDLIVTGDHHKPFTYEYRGRLLVNPGCLSRQVADYSNHQPRVYFWYADSNTVTPHYLQIEEGVVSREHIQIKQERDKRLDAFVSRLSDNWEVGVSFEESLERFFSTNHIRKSVSELVLKAVES